MKKYSNPSRKPMMYGGAAMKPKKRSQGSTDRGEKKAKADAMANAETQSRVATGKATPKDKEAMQRQLREDFRRQIKTAKEEGDMAAMGRFKKKAEGTGSEAMIIRGILQDMGLVGRSPGDQETTN